MLFSYIFLINFFSIISQSFDFGWKFDYLIQYLDFWLHWGWCFIEWQLLIKLCSYFVLIWCYDNVFEGSIFPFSFVLLSSILSNDSCHVIKLLLIHICYWREKKYLLLDACVFYYREFVIFMWQEDLWFQTSSFRSNFYFYPTYWFWFFCNFF